MLLLVGSQVSSCSSGGSAGGASTNTSSCEAACAHCAADPCADCAAYSDRFRDEYEAALYSCVNNADACSSSVWETCAGQAVQAVGTRSIDEDYASACMSKRSSCESEGVSIVDDYCFSQFLSPTWVDRAQQCLTQSCIDALTCLNGIFK